MTPTTPAEAMREEAARVAERTTAYDDNLQKSTGCRTTGQRIAAAIRAIPLPAPVGVEERARELLATLRTKVELMAWDTNTDCEHIEVVIDELAAALSQPVTPSPLQQAMAGANAVQVGPDGSGGMKVTIAFTPGTERVLFGLLSDAMPLGEGEADCR